MWVRGYSMSLKITPFVSFGTVSYSSSVVTMAVSIAISEIFNGTIGQIIHDLLLLENVH